MKFLQNSISYPNKSQESCTSLKEAYLCHPLSPYYVCRLFIYVFLTFSMTEPSTEIVKWTKYLLEQQQQTK